LLHLVGSSVLLYLIDDAGSNKNQVYKDICYDARSYKRKISELLSKATDILEIESVITIYKF